MPDNRRILCARGVPNSRFLGQLDSSGGPCFAGFVNMSLGVYFLCNVHHTGLFFYLFFIFCFFVGEAPTLPQNGFDSIEESTHGATRFMPALLRSLGR